MYNFNEMHFLALSKLTTAQIEDLSRFKMVSAGKKANHCNDLTPLHCACVNPNPEVLRAFLKINSDVNMVDKQMRKLIHYAAACENPLNLEILVEHGANLQDLD